MHRPRDNVDVKIHFVAYNVIEESHCYKKKRQLRDKRRHIITTTLIDRKLTAVAFRREEAKRLKDFGDVEPPIIPSAAVIRKAKEQKLTEKYGFLYTNPILNLLQSAKSKYQGTIHNIGLLEFCCMYWSPEQQLLYRSRSKKDPTGFMTIDATGSIIKRNSDCDSPIFLYQCMFVDSGGSIPVFQMVSADHKAMHIAYFLQKILSKGNEAPRMVVCDFSWAILIAVAQIFSKCVDLRNYLKKCFNILNEVNDTIPSCFIRLDVSHFVSMISRWNCLKQKDKLLVRKFYLRSLCQAYKMNNFIELYSFFEAILVVALSEYIGSNKFGEELPSESRLQYINNIIKFEQMPEISNEVNDNIECIESNYSEEAGQEAGDWFQWSTNIYNNAKRIAINCMEGTTINACFNPDFAAIMKMRLIPYVAIWSGVMQQYFQIDKVVATSTSVEAEFAELKNREFKDRLPMRVDKFVHEHLNYIDGRIKLASCKKDILNEDYEETSKVTHNSSANSAEIEIKKSIDNRFSSDASNCSVIKNISPQNNNIQDITISDTSDIINKENLDCNVCENWRGTVRKSSQEQVKKRRKPSYLDKCPEWDYVKLARDQNIPLMRNGNICKNVTLDGKIIMISDTCAFDSILHLIASGIANIKTYEGKVKHSNNRTIKLAISILNTGKITRSHYNERAKILIDLPLFRDALTVYDSNIWKLNANCNVAHLNNYLFNDIPNCRITLVCPCGYLRRRQIVELNINVDIILQNGLQYMQQAIDDALAIATKCRKCLTPATEHIEYGPHLFIDTTIFTDARYNKPNKTITHSIKDIATDIKLGMKTYVLIGLINYKSGHYITYARSGTRWYEYDDIKKKEKLRMIKL